MSRRLHGTIAAACTPLADGGTRLIEDAFGPYADFFVDSGSRVSLAFGTNGEGVLLSVAERRRGLERWLGAVAGRILVAAHCGVQTTADTVALATHAAQAGADAVAVIGPPYFKLDPVEQRSHLLAAASLRAASVLRLRVRRHALRARPVDAGALLRDEAEHRHGDEGVRPAVGGVRAVPAGRLDIFVGPEALIHLGREAGAVGAVSALASAFPAEVAGREPTADGAARLGALRAHGRFPRPAALKRIVGLRGVSLRSDVRQPLRDLDAAEAAELEARLAQEVRLRGERGGQRERSAPHRDPPRRRRPARPALHS